MLAKNRFRTRSVAVLAVVAVIIVSSASVVWGQFAEDGIVSGCLSKSGFIRGIGKETGACRTGEAPVSWHTAEGAEAAFLAIEGKAADSDLLDGLDSTDFALAGDFESALENAVATLQVQLATLEANQADFAARLEVEATTRRAEHAAIQVEIQRQFDDLVALLTATEPPPDLQPPPAPETLVVADSGFDFASAIDDLFQMRLNEAGGAEAFFEALLDEFNAGFLAPFISWPTTLPPEVLTASTIDVTIAAEPGAVVNVYAGLGCIEPWEDAFRPALRDTITDPLLGLLEESLVSILWGELVEITSPADQFTVPDEGELTVSILVLEGQSSLSANVQNPAGPSPCIDIPLTTP